MIELCLSFKRLHGSLMPMNYQYELSSWVYHVIGTADPNHSGFLHEKGFQSEGRKFKLFTFSQLDMRPYTIEGENLRLHGEKLNLTIRFLVDHSLQNFIKGLFSNQDFFLGNKESGVDLRVEQVQVLPNPEFKPLMRYTCLSPICVSAIRADNTAEYLSPEAKNYGERLLNNLIQKQKAFASYSQPELNSEVLELNPTPACKFRLLNTPRKKGIHIKLDTAQHTQLIGYLFHFELLAPTELHEIGYYAGFGEKNSMGFGCLGYQNN